MAAYSSATPDPVSKFSAPVCGHMNADHQADMTPMVTHYTGLTGVESVTLTGIDHLGMDGEVRGGAGVSVVLILFWAVKVGRLWLESPGGTLLLLEV